MADKTSREYWIKRAEMKIAKLEKDQNKIEKNLKAQYKEVIKQLKKELAALKADGTLTDFQEFRMQGTIASVESILDEMARNEEQILEDGMVDVFKHTAELDAASLETSFSTVNDNFIRETVRTNWSGTVFSERIWENRRKLGFKIKEVMTQGLIRGDSLQTMARTLADTLNKDFNRAMTLMHTETCWIQCEASKRQFMEDGVEEYEYLAFIDERTTEECRNLDGKIFKVEDGKAGVNMPPMHPRCRSAIMPVVESLTEIKERKAREEEEKRRKAEEEEKRKAEEERLRLEAEEKARQEEEAKKKAEEEAAKPVPKWILEEEKKKKAAERRAKKKAEEEAARLKAEEALLKAQLEKEKEALKEAERKAKEAEEKQKEEERKRKEAEEKARKSEELRLKALARMEQTRKEREEKARKEAEEKAKAEEEKRKAEEKARKEAEKKAKEEEKKRKAEEKKRKEAEEKAKKAKEKLQGTSPLDLLIKKRDAGEKLTKAEKKALGGLIGDTIPDKVKALKAKYRPINQNYVSGVIHEGFVEKEDIWFGKDLSIYNSYVQTSNSFSINKQLYTGKYKPEKNKGLDYQVTQLTNLISKTKLEDDTQLVRFSGTEYLKTVYKDVGIKNPFGSKDMELEFELDEAVEMLNAALAGKTTTHKSFTSVSYDVNNNVFTNRPIMMEIYADKGIEALYTANHVESEIVLQRDTEFEIIGFEAVRTKDAWGYFDEQLKMIMRAKKKEV